MVKDHVKTSKELKALVDSGKVKATLPTVLDSEHQLLDDLKAKSGKDFDASFDQAQVKGHQGCRRVVRGLCQGRRQCRPQEMVGRTLPHLKQHLAMAEKLK
jgi:putative membrane protein